MQRLFVAIDLPEAVRQELALLKMDIPGVRWVVPSQLHLTLRFIGDIGEEEVLRLLQELSSIRFGNFSLQLLGTGYFQSRGLPRILWAGVSESKHLAKLQEEIEKACIVSGALPDNRPFSPHLTVARIKGGKTNDVRQYVLNHRGFRSSRFKVERFHLYSSTLDKDGAIHRVLATVNAKGTFR